MHVCSKLNVNIVLSKVIGKPDWERGLSAISGVEAWLKEFVPLRKRQGHTCSRWQWMNPRSLDAVKLKTNFGTDI